MNNRPFNKIRSWMVDQGWVVIVVTFLTILLGILLSELQAKIGWPILLVSLLTILAIFSIVIWLITRHVFSVSVSLAEGIQNTLDKYIGSEKIGWIITTPQLVKFEEEYEVSEIWLISSDLDEDIIGAPFQKVVSLNLKRGVRYRYFVPNRLEIHSRVEQLIKHNNNPENLKFTYLKDDFFFLVPRFDFAIYNPFKEKTGKRIAYMGIPVAEKGRYHARIGDELIDVLIGKLFPLIEKEEKATK